MRKRPGQKTRKIAAIGAVAVALMASGAVGQPSRVFVTSTLHDGNLGGLDGADMICNDLATTTGLGGTWVAWLSTSTVDAVDRLGSGPFVRATDPGVVIANDIPDLTDGSLSNSIAFDEAGMAPGNLSVYTGTDTTGIAFPVSGNFCNDWTDGVTDTDVVRGLADSVTANWTTLGTTSCRPPSSARPIYCFEPGAVEQPSRVFVTSTLHEGDLGGLDGADMICNDLATTAGLGGTWVAWLSTSTVDAIDRLIPGSGPFVRATDPGVLIANDIPDLTDGSLSNSIAFDEAGMAPGNLSVYTGTDTAGIAFPVSGNFCNDWTDSVTGTDVVRGLADSVTADWTALGIASCSAPSNALPIYCFEVTSPIPIPAASGWGLALLGGGLMLAGRAFLRRRQRTG